MARDRRSRKGKMKRLLKENGLREHKQRESATKLRRQLVKQINAEDQFYADLEEDSHTV